MSVRIGAHGLSRSHPGRTPWSRRRPALAGVDLQLAGGSRVGLVGGSGSGKTTLLRCLLALDPPDSGQVTCDGRLVRPGPARSLRWFRRLVQYVPQDPASSLNPRMSVADLVAEPLRRLAVPGQHPALVAAALTRVELPGDLAGRRAGELSGGQAQRVALARAVVTRPALLLADEPVSGLDLPLRNSVLSVLARLSAEHGTGIVLVSHDLSAVAQLCERVVVLDGGRVVEDRSTTDLLRDPRHPASQALLAAVPRLPAAAHPYPEEGLR
jgi:peptide/nickel transport system ATP-binding protein